MAILLMDLGKPPEIVGIAIRAAGVNNHSRSLLSSFYLYNNQLFSLQ